MNYTTTKPTVGCIGTDASFTAYFENDNYLEVDVDMAWDGKHDELEITKIDATYYNEDGVDLDDTVLDLEKIVIDTFEKHNTFGKAESLMAQSYKDDHNE